MWLIGGKWMGLNSYVVAMIPVTVFVITGIITAKDLRGLSWDVLWLVSGGIALGQAMMKTGLSENIIASIPFETMPGVVVLVVGALVAWLMSTFISNTATANLVLPLMASLGASLESLKSLGGAEAALLAATFACSLAMALPISTPPNSMAHASGMIESKDLIKVGVPIGLAGLALVGVMLFLMSLAGML